LTTEFLARSQPPLTAARKVLLLSPVYWRIESLAETQPCPVATRIRPCLQ